MFRIKICGITRPEDAQHAAEAGADAIGLNFYRPSPRYIDPSQAAAIVNATPKSVARVGVFVNETPQAICDLFDQLPLDLIQLHGDEPPEMLAELGDRPVLRAFRCRTDLTEVGNYLLRCNQLHCLPRMVLIDAYSDTHYGGTGARADWSAILQGRDNLHGLPLVLAGGLTPDVVANAIAQVVPQAVDTASGVEQKPGQKSPRLVQQFVSQAQAAFAKTAQPNA